MKSTLASHDTLFYMMGFLEKRFLLGFFLACFMVFFSPLGVNAQSLGGISLSSIPKYPEPHETVTVSLNQYGVNTFGATIRWYLDDVEQVDYRNERSMTFVAGDIGERSTVGVLVTQGNGITITDEKVFVPVLVDLVLEADTYVPYFYKGRALPSAEADIRVITLVHDSSGVTTYTYKWSLAGSVLFGGPVRGKSVAELKMPQFDNKRLSVEVSDSSGNMIAENSIVLRNEDPKLLFYEENPLRGLVERAVSGRLSLLGEETTVFGEPYYLNTSELGTHTEFEWSVSGRSVPSGASPNEVTLRKTGNGGSAQIALEVVADGLLPQFVKRSFELLF